MDFEELKQQSVIKVLIEGESGKGKTYRASVIALKIARAGGKVLYVDTEAEGSTTLVALIEDEDTPYTKDDVDNIEYVQPNNYGELRGYVDKESGTHSEYDLIILDTLDHKHSYVLKSVTDAKRESGADWQEYASIYAEEKNLMEQLGKPSTNILATLDPDSGSTDKPKGAQANVRGYFTAVIRLLRADDGYSHQIKNWVNKGDAVGMKHPDLENKIADEVMERSDR